jgi:hypothetical protein
MCLLDFLCCQIFNFFHLRFEKIIFLNKGKFVSVPTARNRLVILLFKFQLQTVDVLRNMRLNANSVLPKSFLLIIYTIN